MVPTGEISLSQDQDQDSPITQSSAPSSYQDGNVTSTRKAPSSIHHKTIVNANKTKQTKTPSIYTKSVQYIRQKGSTAWAQADHPSASCAKPIIKAISD